MHLLVFAVTAFITPNLANSYSLQYEENRIDAESEYVKYQDIYKAFNITPDFYWLFGFNFHSKHTENKSCVYFDVETLNEEGMNYSSNFIRYGTSDKIEYIGQFYSTTYKNMSVDQKRDRHNSLYARTKSGTWVPMNYTLIYSDYQNCSIFRVLQAESGYGCMVLLTNAAAYIGMPNACKQLYKNACAKYHHDKFENVFNNTCHRTNLNVSHCRK
uniref:Lipocalin/cytosolic fatty-acid binding domain-containing protein n=1 Tax=Amblyomma maculatum TaxID=34609 RepID=G3MQF9_AMBMU